jgi:hypothetical protein
MKNVDPFYVLESEWNALGWHFDVVGLAPHRDINYSHNSLPWLEQNWDANIKKNRLLPGLEYHAYEKRIMDSVTYVNEGLSPHLGWRDNKPEDVIKQDRSIYMLTHNHWWYDVHPFEHQ